MIMAAAGSLVDLSLFATSPADDHRFTTSYVPPTINVQYEAPCYRAQSELNQRYGGDAMKPLPPLPHRKICERRPGARRFDPNSRCILTRIRRVRTHEQLGNQSPSLQQRRAAATPQLTLSLPQTSREGGQRGYGGNVQSTMVWLPDEQMWLVQDEVGQNNRRYPWQYSSQPVHQYTRSEPSPERSAQFDWTPMEPTRDPYSNLDDPPDEIRDQFLRLIGPPRDDRLSPLFQEAIQAVPPMTDPSPSTPHFSHDMQQDWVSRNLYENQADGSHRSSDDQSYHTANASLLEQSTYDAYPISSPSFPDRTISPTSQPPSSWLDRHHHHHSFLTRESLWSPITTSHLAEEQTSASSRVSRSPWSYSPAYGFEPYGPGSVVSQVTQERLWGEEPRNVISPLSNEDFHWEALARGVARPSSAMN